MSRFSILVVDDDPVIRSAVTRWVETEGYHAATASAGLEALAGTRRVFWGSPDERDLALGGAA